jgi:hypothetical protein
VNLFANESETDEEKQECELDEFNAKTLKHI